VTPLDTVVGNPFPGLRPFESSESHLFFGRDEQVDELLIRFQRLRFLGVVGTSGCGKSSLIRAGLLPALYRGCLATSGSRWRVALVRPGGAPIRNLATVLAAPEALGQPGGDPPVDEMQEALERSSLGLVQATREFPLPPRHNLLVVVDQFEEIFRFKQELDQSGGEEPAAFVKLLLAAVQEGDAPISIVLTMRSDFLGECAQFRGLPEALNDAQYLVPRLTRDQRKECIEGPVAVAGASITPRLVQRVLNDVGDDPDQLPILQHALMRTWEASRQDRERGQPLDLLHYEAVGGMAHALDRHAEEALAGMDPALVHTVEAVKEALAVIRDAEECRILFQALTDTDYANRKIRRWQSLRQLRELTGRSLPEVRLVLERFCDDRRSFLHLSDLRGSTDPEEALVDISHESLIRQWARLRGWADEEAHNRDTYLRVRDEAIRWRAGTGGLWEEPALAQACLWWDDRFRPTPLWANRYGGGFETAAEFLLESKRKRDREIQRKQEELRKENERKELEVRNALMRRTVRRTLAAAVVAGTLALVALYQWRRAEAASARAESGEHAARSLAVTRTDAERSLALAIQAAERAHTSTSEEALRQALAAAVIRKRWSVPLGLASAVAFSPDGRRLAAGAAAGKGPGRVGIWDVDTAELLTSVCGWSVEALRWSPDGKGLLLGLEDSRVVYWGGGGSGGPAADMTTLVPGAEVGQIEDLDVRPDGRELAVAAGEKGVLRFDIDLTADPGATPPSARRRASPRAIAAGPDDAVASVAYSPDGRRLAAGGSKGAVTLVDTATGKRLCQTRPLLVELLRVGFSGPELGLVAASSLDHTLRSWPADSCASPPARYVGHRQLVTDFVFTDDGDYLVSVSHDGTIRLWDPRKGEEAFNRRVARYDFNRVTTARPGSSRGASDRAHIATIGTASGEGDAAAGTLTLWDVASRKEAEELKDPGAPVRPHEDEGGRLRDLLQRARDLRIEPLSRKDQVPGCR
jgi:WD40 repeat protein